MNCHKCGAFIHPSWSKCLSCRAPLQPTTGRIPERREALAEHFAGFVRRVYRRLARPYPAGCIAYTREKTPELWARIKEAEGRIDSGYEPFLRGGLGWPEYRSNIYKWARLHVRAMRRYKQSTATRKAA